MRIRIKICGITTLEAALAAVEAGADALGFVFAPSKRKVEPETVKHICSVIPALVSRVGVFVNSSPQDVKCCMETCSLNTLQFHGEETPEYLRHFDNCSTIKAISVKNRNFVEMIRSYPKSTLLLDAYHPHYKGGSGQAFDWSLLNEIPANISFLLAGGLNPENVTEALRVVRPYGLDISSGVETKGQKDPHKIYAFINQVRRWEEHEGHIT